MGNRRPQLLFICWLFSIALRTETQAKDHVVSSSWRLLASRPMAAFQAVTRVRSKVECIRECQRYSHCNSFVFKASSHTCYMLPTLQNITAGKHLEDKVYANTDFKCNVNNAPTSNGTVVWSHTLTSLRGKVTCYDDFINSTDDVNVQCLADGSWQRQGLCLRHTWHNPSLSLFPVPVPVPVVNGWSVCLNGTPTGLERFTVELMIGPADQALHADFRFNHSGDVNRTLLSHKLRGNFLEPLLFAPFPFRLGQPFRLKIAATAGTFQVYVNESLHANHTQHPNLPATSITAVNVRNDIMMTYFDIVCSA